MMMSLAPASKGGSVASAASEKWSDFPALGYVGLWHNPDLRLAVSEGPLTITFRTLATEGMRPGLKGLTGLYGALAFLNAFCGRCRQAPPISKLAPETDL